MTDNLKAREKLLPIHYFLMGIIFSPIIAVIFGLSYISSTLQIYNPIWFALLVIYLVIFVCFCAGFKAKGNTVLASIAFAFWSGLAYLVLCIVIAFLFIMIIFGIPTS